MARALTARAFQVAAAGAVAALVAGCGSASQSLDVPENFGADPLETVASQTGQLSVVVRTSPPPPVRGPNAVELTVTDDTGAPVDGLDVSVMPWMPAHGHGTSIQPTTTARGGGVYVATPVVLYMAG